MDEESFLTETGLADLRDGIELGRLYFPRIRPLRFPLAALTRGKKARRFFQTSLHSAVPSEAVL